MHRVALLVFDGFQLLDATGPASVFGAANAALEREAYRVAPVSAGGGPVRSSAGVALVAEPIAAHPPEELGTALAVGGEAEALRAAAADRAAQGWFARAAAAAERYGSVCSGAALLAAWGLADGRRVATHWSAAGPLARAYPALKVDRESIFVADDRLWTSAGVSAGIDMALAMVARDGGPALAREVTRRLVLSVRRPGYQSQFGPLTDPAPADAGYDELLGWIDGNLRQPLTVEALAARAGQSPRNFQRRFAGALGRPPAAYVAARRLDRARELLHRGASLKRAAAACGFADADHLSAALRRATGLNGREYQRLHAAERPAAGEGGGPG